MKLPLILIQLSLNNINVSWGRLILWLLVVNLILTGCIDVTHPDKNRVYRCSTKRSVMKTFWNTILHLSGKQSKLKLPVHGTNLSTSIVKKLTSPRAHFEKFNVKDCAVLVAYCTLCISYYAVLLSEWVSECITNIINLLVEWVYNKYYKFTRSLSWISESDWLYYS